MRFSAKRCAYSDMPSFSSQSAIRCIGDPVPVYGQPAEPRAYQLSPPRCSGPPCRRHVRIGSIATEPFGAGADQCLLFPQATKSRTSPE